MKGPFSPFSKRKWEGKKVEEEEEETKETKLTRRPWPGQRGTGRERRALNPSWKLKIDIGSWNMLLKMLNVDTSTHRLAACSMNVSLNVECRP